jgi:hypothetical protein
VSREELRGIPRPGNDVDWTQEVPTISLTATTLPPPIQISLSDILNKVSTKKPQLLLPNVNNAAPVNGIKMITLNIVLLLSLGRPNFLFRSISVNCFWAGPTGSNAKTICYYTSWSANRPGLGRFSPEEVNTEVLVQPLLKLNSFRFNFVLNFRCSCAPIWSTHSEP